MRIAFFDLAFNFVFLTVGLNSYPYIISSRIRWLLATLFLVIGFFISRMLQQFRNNPIFLRMSGREFSNWDPVLVQQLLLLGAVPFVVLLAFVYPRFGRWIIDMLVPITAVLNGK
jgi:hypothetical protein